MVSLRVKKAAINAARLHADLRKVLGETLAGVSFSRGVVHVHLVDAATLQQQKAAREVVEGHDPALLSCTEQAVRERGALPFFKLDEEALVAHAAALDDAAFRAETARAFALLRDMLRG